MHIARDCGVGLVWVVGGVIGIAIAPVVAAVATPILGIKALVSWAQHRSLHERTLTNLTREKYGRIAGQDYTRWDGKATGQAPTEQEALHEELGEHVHGYNDNAFQRDNGAADCPFKTEQDRAWLQLEGARRAKLDQLNEDVKLLRAFAKLLFPVIGVIWALLTELGRGGASEMGCRVCGMGGDAENKHWSWGTALDFHRSTLRGRLAQS